MRILPGSAEATLRVGSKSLMAPRAIVPSLRRTVAIAFVGGVVLGFALPVLLSMTATAVALPDLTADGWLDHEPVIEGYPYVLTLAIWNVGDAPAGNFTVLMQYSGHGGPDLLRIPASDPLMPGEKRVVRTANLTGSQGTLGFGITMDSYNEITESNESNNQVNRLWDGISPAERPIFRETIQGNVTRLESLPTESTLILNATLRKDDRLRYQATGQSGTQQFDVFLFVGQTNLNTYFGFGTLSPEILQRGITTAQGDFTARQDDVVFLVVDNLSDGPYPPWPKLLNVTVTIEIERAPPASTTLPTGLGPLWIPIAIVGGTVFGVGGAIAGALLLRRRSQAAEAAPAAWRPLDATVCSSCGTRATASAQFCGRCGARLTTSGAGRNKR